jgi:hypothetical protein
MIYFSLTISQSQNAATTRHSVTEQLRRNMRQPTIIIFSFGWCNTRQVGNKDAERT